VTKVLVSCWTWMTGKGSSHLFEELVQAVIIANSPVVIVISSEPGIWPSEQYPQFFLTTLHLAEF